MVMQLIVAIHPNPEAFLTNRWYVTVLFLLIESSSVSNTFFLIIFLGCPRGLGTIVFGVQEREKVQAKFKVL